ncbi:MAG: YdcF family protein, partial [Telluria sp.]
MVDGAPEYGGKDAPDAVTLVRLQYGAWLQHQSALPVLVSGGIVPGTTATGSLGAMMARTLRDDFRTPVTWIEDQSVDTNQNAVYSARMLKAAGVSRIMLVTHALHMSRSRQAFARQGIAVVEAPTMFYSRARWSPWMLLPSTSGLYRSYYAMHEWVGMAWYRFTV